MVMSMILVSGNDDAENYDIDSERLSETCHLCLISQRETILLLMMMV